MKSLDLETLRKANMLRQDHWCKNGQKPDVTYRAMELGGEVGEALNEIKKLERERLGWDGSRTTLEKVADELADILICTDLVASELNIDLSEAVWRKFNKTSEKVDISVFINKVENFCFTYADMTGLPK